MCVVMIIRCLWILFNSYGLVCSMLMVVMCMMEWKQMVQYGYVHQ